MNDNEKVGNLIFDLSLKCEEILKKECNPKITTNESATTVGYYLSIIEYNKSLGILVREGKYILIPHICRSVLEAVIDLLNLSKESDFYYVLRKISFLGNKRRAKSWRVNKDNPLHPNIEELPKDFNNSEKFRNTKLEEINEIIKDKFPKDITELKVRFKNAGLEDLYESIYWLTSPEVHNDISIIWERHIKEKEGKAFFYINPTGGIGKYSPHINLIVMYLVAGLGEIISKIEGKNFDEYFFELEEKRKSILGLIS